MSRRVTIDRINSKYRESYPSQRLNVVSGLGGVGTVGTIETIGTTNHGVVGGVTALRRSTVTPSVIFGGNNAIRTSAVPIAGQTIVSGLPATGSVLYPATNTQTIVRRSRVDLYPSLSNPSAIVPTVVPTVVPAAPLVVSTNVPQVVT